MRLARGTARDLLIPILNSDGTPYDLTGVPVRVLVKRAVEDTDALITKVSSNPAQIVLESNVIRCKFVGTDTRTLDPGTFWYDAWGQDTETSEWYALTEPRQFQLYRSVSEV